jgi:hypothetical protein
LFLLTDTLGGLIFLEIIEVVLALWLRCESANILVGSVGAKIELLLWLARCCMDEGLPEELTAVVAVKSKASGSF